MDCTQEDDSSGPSSLSSDQASLCVIPDPDESSEEDGFIYLDKSSLPENLNPSEQGRTVIVFHSVDEEYPANQNILCQYIRPEGWQESSQDGISLFKVGWVSAAEYIAHLSVPEPGNALDSIGCVLFPADVLPKDASNLYQFCYMREAILLGASTPFQFLLSHVDSLNDTPVVLGDSDVKTIHVNPCEKENQVLESGLKHMHGVQVSDPNENLLVGSCTKLVEDGMDQEKKITVHTFSAENRCASTEDSVETCLKEKALCLEQELECLMQSYSDLPQISETPLNLSNHVNLHSMKFCTEFNNRSISGTSWTLCCDNGCSVMKNSGHCCPSQENAKKDSQEKAMWSNLMGENYEKDVEEMGTKQPMKDELLRLRKRLEEVNEEKQWFQEQYNSSLIAMKKYSDDLATERSQKDSINGHMAELMISHKMLCSENARLNAEVENLKQNSQRNSKADELLIEKHLFEKQLSQVVSENACLKKEMDYLESQLKVNNDSENPSECKCETYRQQLDDMNGRLSAFEVMRNCLEVEIEEEIKLGQERDSYVTKLEQIKVHGFQMANNWLASTPNSSDNGSALLEMEENVNSTLEALECALKEMEVLRTRKAAVSRANRVLREELMQKRKEWESQLHKERANFNAKLCDLQKQLECEKTSKCALTIEVESLRVECKRLNDTIIFGDRNLHDSKAPQKNDEVNLGVVEQKPDLDEEFSLLQQKFKDLEIDEDINSTLLRNLKEARDEYKKLYAEKVRIQEKLARLQQKVRTKKNSRSQQETAKATSSDSDPASDFMKNVSTSWRALVDELM